MISDELPDSKAAMAAVERFRTFLNMAWPIINDVLGDHDWDNDAYFLEDWLDANWELLVCRQLFGKGADLQPFSIAVNEVMKDRHDYRLESATGDSKIFVTLGSSRGGFTIAPPFDKVKVIAPNGAIEVLAWSALNFKIRCKP